MKKFNFASDTMMDMCMWNCCMCMAFRTSVSDKFSASQKKTVPLK